VILVVLGWALTGGPVGCRPKDAEAPEPTARELWRRGEIALADGEVAAAAELFGRSLAGESTPDRRREAAERIASAGRPDLAAALVAGQAEPELAALAQAIAIYRQGPPGGYAGEPGVVCVMAEALLANAAAARWAAVTPPRRLSASDLAIIGHHWQKWLLYRRLFSGAEPPAPAKAMVLWRRPRAVGLAGGTSERIAHPAGTSEDAAALVHLGSWRLGSEDLTYDAVALAQGQAASPAELLFVAWRGRYDLPGLAVRGTMADDGLIVQAASDLERLTALSAVLTDPTIATGRVVPRDAAERREILHLAERLHLASCVRADGGALVAVGGDGDGPPDVSSGQWLTDLAVYVRYGRGALR